MTERKYARYIFTDVPRQDKPLPVPKRIQEQRAQGNYIEATWMFALEDSAAQGAFYTNCVWLWEKKGRGPLELEIAHTHDFDETLGFVGTVRDNPRDLGGEIELYLEDERYVLTESCLIFVPRGMKHLPLYLNRLDSPVFFWTAGNGSAYTRTSGDEF